MMYLLGAVVLFVSTFIGIELIKERLLANAAARATASDLDEIADELGKVGNVPSKSFYLIRKSPKLLGSFTVGLPQSMDVRWLQGRTIHISLKPDPGTEDDVADVTIVEIVRESNFHTAPIPRIAQKNGKEVNRHQPEYWFKKNERLEEIAKALHPKRPADVLRQILDRIGRVNAPFEWVQNPPKAKCESCRKKLQPVLQIYGGILGFSSDAEYYIAACECTQGKFYTFGQYS